MNDIHSCQILSTSGADIEAQYRAFVALGNMVRPGLLNTPSTVSYRTDDLFRIAGIRQQVTKRHPGPIRPFDHHKSEQQGSEQRGTLQERGCGDHSAGFGRRNDGLKVYRSMGELLVLY